MVQVSNIKVVLLDIEGTTTPLSFVKDKLFGYVRKNLRIHLEENFSNDEVQEDIKAIITTATTATTATATTTTSNTTNKSTLVENVIEIVTKLMDEDRKSTSLKQLQGHMFRQAFQSKAVVGEIYPDVLPFIQSVISKGSKVAIYSSGSIFAQKLLFGNTVNGDLSELITDYFDTTTGPKVQSSSYVKISQHLNVTPSEILFLTDLVQEAVAAREATLQAVLVARDDSRSVHDDELLPRVNEFTVIKSFDKIKIMTS
ncbi:hypothetical protein HELRODRAFT_88310 [Helobdella robusta]|uniref:Enolase-phosphatase E1 n=1 Tax=Helobdella robusta TaxID=6412 RepID=T1G715_HELRO|nr:hypothetical protein HELRODRAFT_88310 [Helobdella robusta]ESN93715.1 hypothetical protein HELRODRAFT_88310 [Helobdella robusta]